MSKSLKIKEKCNTTCSEFIPVCVAIVVIIIFIFMIIVAFEPHKYYKNNYEEYVHEHETLIKESSKFVIRSGWWPDGNRECSPDKPCILNCAEYNRFKILCDPDNLDCTMGRYDYCKDEPNGPFNG